MVRKIMKACMLTAPNKFAIREVPVPSPERGEVLCRIRAIAICGTDPEIVDGTHLSKGWPPRFPFILGHEWSGEVVEIGPGFPGLNRATASPARLTRGAGFARIA